MREHAGMSLRSLDIMMSQALVELNRRGEGFDKGIGGLGEPSGPGFLLAAHEYTDDKTRRHYTAPECAADACQSVFRAAGGAGFKPFP